LATDEPVVLVGGQAVNIWALYYEDRTRDLAPFVSRDVDVLGDRQTLITLARLAGTQPQFFPWRPPTKAIGAVIAEGTDGQPLLVEVLRSVHGISNEKLLATAYTVAIGGTEVTVRVPGPIALLRAKVANVADLPQEGRQDTRHVEVLARLMPAYLADLETSVRANTTPERKFVDLLEELLTGVTPGNAGRVLAALDISRERLFAEINTDQLPRVARFMGRRLPRAL